MSGPMEKKLGFCVLAAGLGTRLKLDRPKALAPVMGRTLIDYVIDSLHGLMKSEGISGEIGVVTGHMREKVESYLKSQYGDTISFAFQEKQLGTADAVKAYLKGLPGAVNCEYTVITCADTPLIRDSELQKLYTYLLQEKLDGVAATFIEKNPKGYGRIIRSAGPKGFHIVEEKDATEDQRKICEVNSGLYVVKTNFLCEQLEKVSNKNKSGEFYLTDLFQDHFNVAPIVFPNPEIFLGVNDLIQLETAQKLLGKRKIHHLMTQGVRFMNCDTVLLDESVTVATGSVIFPNVTILGKTKIGEKVVVESGCFIREAQIAADVHILANSYLEECVIEAKASVGPFARIRPGTVLGEKAKVGNFVEIKKSILGKGAKVSHLSYVGDAEVGEESNIGCGFITCNYDGANKHKTKIGKNVFIGSDSQAVAPVTIGDNCFVAAASTITNDMPEGSFAISRNKQTTKEGMAHRFLKKKS